MVDLVELYRDRVFRFCYRMLGQRQDAEDAAQETFVRMLRSLAAWDGRRDFEPWLLGIAGNRCRTLLAAQAEARHGVVCRRAVGGPHARLARAEFVGRGGPAGTVAATARTSRGVCLVPRERSQLRSDRSRHPAAVGNGQDMDFSSAAAADGPAAAARGRGRKPSCGASSLSSDCSDAWIGVNGPRTILPSAATLASAPSAGAPWPRAPAWPTDLTCWNFPCPTSPFLSASSATSGFIAARL